MHSLSEESLPTWYFCPDLISYIVFHNKNQENILGDFRDLLQAKSQDPRKYHRLPLNVSRNTSTSKSK